MKRIFIVFAMLIACVCMTMAQEKQASIKFEKINYNFGKFSEKEPVQKCVFTFVNQGTAPLVINQAIASCGCTIPSFTKTPIKPGEKGEIKVTYNGRGTFPGHFKKTITVRSNGVTELTRLYIEGVMEEAK
ncbi:DUF1573 domain-containing protein [Prevotella sp.]|uniref:DUF1573 domain-containing protein n=1 Tax=Prevotella sp. TaxID=59823 RepID=UPI00260047A0|nr:DUF1573 domain-containing protein [Prevotella sp.]